KDSPSTSPGRNGGERALLPLLLLDPRTHFRFQHIQRDRAVAQHRVVEGADVEAGAEFAFGALAQGADAELADLVAQRLRGPADVAVHLGLDIRLGQRTVVAHEGDRSLLRPALR